LKAKGDYRPESYAYEVVRNGDAVIRFYENIDEYTEKGEDGHPDVTGYTYDRYTITRPHSTELRARIGANPGLWLAFAKELEAEQLATAARIRRDAALAETDRTQLPDADIADKSREDYRVYRQALRNIPEQPGFPYEIDWPEVPVYEKASKGGSV